AHDLRIAINMRGAHLHPYMRRAFDLAHRLAEDARGFYARSQDFVLMIRSLDAIDRSADEIHDCCGAVERTGPWSNRSSVPRSMPRGTCHLRSLARENHDGMAGLGQMRRKRDAKKSASACDDDRAGFFG